MRLIELRANKESFRKVRFNRSGLTLIVGSRSDAGVTYNGVGKSLIVKLLHFCMGSSGNEELGRKLPSWEFLLQFELGPFERPELHTVSRNTSKQRTVFLDNAAMPVDRFLEWLTPRTFSIPSGVSDLTFRSLLPHFLRRGLADYVNPLSASDYSPMRG